MASWLRRAGAYPYERPGGQGSSDAAASQQVASSSGRSMADGHEARASRKLADSIQRFLRSWPGAKQLWEVAVTRNSLTTSLVLLSSVLVADALMVDQRQLKHFSLRAHMGAHDESSHHHHHHQQDSQHGAHHSYSDQAASH